MVVKTMIDHNPDYSISENGYVIHIPTNKKVKLYLVKGYYKFRMKVFGIYKMVSLHRMIAHYFISNPDNKPCVNHKNGIKTDNNISNLEWCTIAENNLHKYRVLGYSGFGGSKPKKITATFDGVRIATFKSSRAASRITGFNQGNIARSARDGIVSYGFIWKYEFN